MSYIEDTHVFDPQTQSRARVDYMKSLNTESRVRLLGSSFGAAIDTNFWTAANNGAGSAAGVANGIATISSGTANSGYGSMISARLGRFLFANLNLYRGAVRLTSVAVTDGTGRWGAFNTTAGSPPTYNNGFYFAVSPAGVLSVNTLSNGTPVSIASGAFNGETGTGANGTYVLDTNVHAYEILYYVMKVAFFIDGVLIHTFTPTTAVLSQDFNLKATAIVVNGTSSPAGRTLELWAATIMRIGEESTLPKYAFISTNTTTVLKLGPGRLHAVIIGKIGSSNTVTIYDNTAASGTVIATIDGAANTGTYDFHVDFQTGLTILTASGTTPFLTFVYD